METRRDRDTQGRRYTELRYTKVETHSLKIHRNGDIEDGDTQSAIAVYPELFTIAAFPSCVRVPASEFQLLPRLYL